MSFHFPPESNFYGNNVLNENSMRCTVLIARHLYFDLWTCVYQSIVINTFFLKWIFFVSSFHFHVSHFHGALITVTHLRQMLRPAIYYRRWKHCEINICEVILSIHKNGNDFNERQIFINVTRAKKEKNLLFLIWDLFFGYGVSFDLCLLVYYYHDVCGFTISQFFFTMKSFVNWVWR